MPPAESAPAEGPDAEDTAAPEVPPPAATPCPAMLEILVERGMREDWSDDRRTWEIKQLALQSVMRERELYAPAGEATSSPTVAPWKTGKARRGEQFFGGSKLKS